MSEKNHTTEISGHYGVARLEETILEGLRKAGIDPDRLSPDDLAPVDQFHLRGKSATLDLAHLANLTPDLCVLDVGGGLGGSARTLAAEFGCRVTVLDITEEYCRVGEALTRRTRQSERVQFQTASAVDMPFPDEAFDVVWTQHSSMNIEPKERLYKEIHRVLRAGGRLAIHEIVAGVNQPIHFPVPWATEPRMSFLRSMADTRATIESAGFAELAFHDRTEATLRWFRARLARSAQASTPVGLHLLLGENFAPAMENQLRNLDEHRIAVIEAVYRKR